MDLIPAGAWIVIRSPPSRGQFEEHPLISRDGGTGQSVSKAQTAATPGSSQCATAGITCTAKRLFPYRRASEVSPEAIGSTPSPAPSKPPDRPRSNPRANRMHSGPRVNHLSPESPECVPLRASTHGNYLPSLPDGRNDRSRSAGTEPASPRPSLPSQFSPAETGQCRRPNVRGRPPCPATRHARENRQRSDGPRWPKVAEVDFFRGYDHGTRPEVTKVQSTPRGHPERPSLTCPGCSHVRCQGTSKRAAVFSPSRAGSIYQ
jgi:hypothetical protein